MEKKGKTERNFPLIVRVGKVVRDELIGITHYVSLIFGVIFANIRLDAVNMAVLFWHSVIKPTNCKCLASLFREVSRLAKRSSST